MVRTKRKSSKELLRPNTKDARTDSLDNSRSSLDSSTTSSPDSSSSSNGGSPKLSPTITPGQRQITDFFTESQVKSPKTQSTPVRNDDSVFTVTSTHHALLDLATGDLFATPSATHPSDYVTVKATDLESLLKANNNLQKQMLNLTAHVNGQKDQIAKILENQEQIIKEIKSPRVPDVIGPMITGDVNSAPGKKKVHTGPNKVKNNVKINEPQPQRNNNRNNHSSHRPKERSQNVEVVSNRLDKHIDNYLPMWRKNHFYRRSEFKRHHLHNEKTKIIQEHIEKKYIPKRFRPRQTNTKAEYHLEEKHSYMTMKHEIEKCTYHSDSARANYENTDQEMIERIESLEIISDVDRDKLKETWILEVSQAVEKAKELCEYNLIYLRNLPKSEPYLGYSGVPNQNANSNNFNLQQHRYNPKHNNRGYAKSGFRR